MRNRFVLAAALPMLAACSGRDDAPQTQPSDETETAALSAEAPGEAFRTLIARARALSEAHGAALWDGWDAAPFGVLLVEDDQETLFCHDGPAGGWRSIGADPLTGCEMRVRPREFPPQLLASFPAIDNTPTIVVGTPQATGRTALAWTVTLLHEHMHQTQSFRPDYHPGVAALDLAGDDQTGIWMLNYPFPYDHPETAAAFTALITNLDAALTAIGTDGSGARVADYLAARAALRATVSEADWRYYEFQLWQEGVARWTEMALSAAAGAGDADLAAYAMEMRESLHRELAETGDEGLDVRKRVAFYPVGAGEAILLEAVAPHWRTRYFSEPFALGPYFSAE